MKALIVLFVSCISIFLVQCASSGEKGDKKTAGAKGSYVFQETLVSGSDTGMKQLASRFLKINPEDVLCQRWEIDEIERSDLAWDEDNNRIYPEIMFFPDHRFTRNPRLQIRFGHWQLQQENNSLLLSMQYDDGAVEHVAIKELKTGSLHFKPLEQDGYGSTYEMVSDALLHENYLNDPFHPQNNRWRIAPPQPENDSLILVRVKQCVRFYALYYRDQIKRKKQVVTFTGLPEIFTWYRRGIGLPDKDELPQSWIDCFYNEQQASMGYDILRNLIVDYEFNWNTKAPTWLHETESVLEQMYHKL